MKRLPFDPRRHCQEIEVWMDLEIRIENPALACLIPGVTRKGEG